MAVRFLKRGPMPLRLEWGLPGSRTSIAHVNEKSHTVIREVILRDYEVDWLLVNLKQRRRTLDEAAIKRAKRKLGI